MKSANNPKNETNSTLAQGSGQISTKEARAHEAAMENDTYPEWVVVEFPGTDRENIVIDFYTAREAFRYIERNYSEDECDVDVMKRRNDGVLTTDF